MDWKDYDFLDFGASKGGSLKWAAATFGGTGVGIEKNPAKYELAKAAGRSVVLADATELDLPERSVRYAVMIDFLEHLPHRAAAKRVIASAARVARDFVYIAGPNFEEGPYLKSCGLKRYYADWHGHSWHHGEAELLAILAELGLRGCVIGKDRIADSLDANLVPLDAPRDGGRYDPSLHAAKPHVRFKKRLFNRLAVLVCLSDDVDPLELFARASGCSYARI